MAAGAGTAIACPQGGLLLEAVAGNEPGEDGLFHCGPDVFPIVFPHMAADGAAP
jgi:hypothetical protein